MTSKMTREMMKMTQNTLILITVWIHTKGLVCGWFFLRPFARYIFALAHHTHCMISSLAHCYFYFFFTKQNPKILCDEPLFSEAFKSYDFYIWLLHSTEAKWRWVRKEKWWEKNYFSDHKREKKRERAEHTKDAVECVYVYAHSSAC